MSRYHHGTGKRLGDYPPMKLYQRIGTLCCKNSYYDYLVI